jgi:hypothetical protein
MISKDKIYVYDAFTNLYNDDEFHLSPNELYLYCFLYRNRSHDYKVRINVETIHQSMPVKFQPSKDTRNRREVKVNLISLRTKGIISFQMDDKYLHSKSGNYTPLEISFNRFTEINGFAEKKAGYTQVAYSDFDSADNINYFYITMAVGRYNNVTTYSGYGGRWISEREFGKLLGMSGRTFKNYADDMIFKGMLYKASGKKKENSNEQDKNTYKTVPFGFEDRKIESSISVKINNTELEKNEIPDGVPTWYDCSESKKNDKRFSVKELRETILNNGKIATEHYFYAHEFEKVDPVIYEAYMLSRKRLEKGGKFDFSKDDALWNERMRGIKSKENEKNRSELIEKMINEKEHILNLNDNSFCYAEDVKDWSMVVGFEIKDNSDARLNNGHVEQRVRQ